MTSATGVDWADLDWITVTGCGHVTSACLNCYAETMSGTRLRNHPDYVGVTGDDGKWNGNVRVHPHHLDDPYKFSGSKMVFVNGMADTFHRLVPTEFIQQMFAVMNNLPQHNFLVLTKRVARMANLDLPWADNIWAGVTISGGDATDAAWAERLRWVPAKVRWISAEPLLGPMNDVDLTNIHWVVIGGESGHGARPMHPAWRDNLIARCDAEGLAVYYKQDGPYGLAEPGDPKALTVSYAGEVRS